MLILNQKNAINIYGTKMEVTLEWHVSDKILTHICWHVICLAFLFALQCCLNDIFLMFVRLYFIGTNMIWSWCYSWNVCDTRMAYFWRTLFCTAVAQIFSYDWRFLLVITDTVQMWLDNSVLLKCWITFSIQL